MYCVRLENRNTTSLINFESMTTNNWSLAIDLSSDSCAGVPRSNAYETIDVRYCWWAAKRCICILVHGSIARDTHVHILGANMLTHVVLSQHISLTFRPVIQLFQPPSCLSSFQVCHLRQDWANTFFSLDTYEMELPYHSSIQIGLDCFHGSTPKSDLEQELWNWRWTEWKSQKVAASLMDT